MEKGLERMKRRKKAKKKRFGILAAAAAAVIILICIFSRSFTSGTAAVTIPEGSSTPQIAEILRENGVIRSKTWFMARLAVSPYKGKLQYGTFKLDKNASLNEIFETLATKGAKKNTVTLTIPEGFSVEKIKQRVCDSGLCTDSEFERALSKNYDYSFLSAVPQSKDINYRLQGFLYPSTYEFYSDADAETIITAMLDEFEKQIMPLFSDNGKLYDTLTKASLIEREAKLDSERPIIAGVIENRLNLDMPLQIDACIVYAISDGLYNVEKVYYKDLQTDSKYNTYKYKGLPAGPICSPGLSSVKAALHPSQHRYLYYHTDTSKNDGSHIFTETYEQHTDSQN